MLLSELKTNLQAVSRGDLVLLDASLLSDAPILGVLTTLLEGATLELGGVVIAESNEEVVIAGKINALGLQDVNLTATFWDEDSQLQSRLEVTLPQGWRFSDSFPSVAPSIHYSSENTGLGASILDSVTIRTAKFVISSQEDESRQLGQGLNFEAELDFQGALEPLRAMANGNSLSLAGLVPLGKAQGDFELRASFPLSLGSEKLAFEAPFFTIKSSLTPDSGLSQTEVEVGFGMTLGSAEVEVVMPFQFGGDNDFVSLNLRGKDGQEPHLADLADAFGGADLEGSLPPSLAGLGTLSLEQLIIGMDLTDIRIAHIQVAIRSSESWVVVEGALTLKELYLYWLIANPFDAATREMEAEIAGLIDLQVVEMEAAATYPGFNLTAAFTEDSDLTLKEVIESVSDSSPGFDDNTLKLSELYLEAQPLDKVFRFAGLLESNWEIDLAFTQLTFKELGFSYAHIPPSKEVLLEGKIGLFDNDWEARASLPEGEDAWQLTASQGEGQTLLLSQVVEDMIEAATGDAVSLPRGLDEVSVKDLFFTLNTGDEKAFQFTGAIDWALDLGDAGTINVQASLDLHSHKPASGDRTYSGQVSGLMDLSELDADFFEFFTIQAVYDFSPNSGELTLVLTVDEVEIIGTIASETDQGTTLTLSFGDTTLADVLNLLVRMADPNRGDLGLDPPWNMLEKASLEGLTISVFLPKKGSSNIPSVTLSKSVGINLGFMEIDKLHLSYLKTSGKPGIFVDLSGTFLGVSYREDDSNKPTRWDALNEEAPAVPGAGSALLDVRYLGLGQRVSLSQAQVSQITRIQEAMDALKATLDQADPEKPWQALQFNADSGLLLGVDMTVLKGFLSLQIIFNDPLIYGLRIGLDGKQAKSLAGLEFEILYRRISDTVGVYHIELVLPDIMRHLEFGAVSLTLPIIVVDIYTNGDFKLDFGFPWKSNFARSFHIQVFPFVGAGGFYFNKLSAETATSTPVIVDSIGAFNPVIEFGLGLKVGLGKAFNKGPLKAEISITVQGIIEGVISWFNPADSTRDKDTYYLIQGLVAIEGRVYGAVDFVVIVVDVEVLARAEVRFRFEVYRKAHLILTAKVSVKASVKVVFVKVKFSFSLTITQEFYIGENTVAPWEDQLPAGLKSLPPLAARALRGSWDPISLWEAGSEKPVLDFFFEPSLTRDSTGTKLVALLFIENTIALAEDDPEQLHTGADEKDTDFDNLCYGLLTWALLEGGGLTDGESAVTVDILEDIHASLSQDALPFSFDTLITWLTTNYTIQVSDRQATGTEMSGTAFPMFPQLSMAAGGSSVDFDSASLALSTEDRERIKQYFQEMRVQLEAGGESQARSRDTSAFTTATYVFVDYFGILLRTSVQQAIDHLNDHIDTAFTVSSLLDTLNADGSFNHLAGIASRFMLHGLRLPKADDSLSPLYTETGQQISYSTAGSIVLSREDADNWLILPEEVDEKPKRLTYSLPASQTSMIAPLAELEDLGLTVTFSTLPLFELVPERFNLHQRITWHQLLADGNEHYTIAPFPGSLLDVLERAGSLPSLVPAKLEPAEDIAEFAWGMKVPLAFRRRSDAEGNFLPNTYELMGTDERSKDLLETLWRAGGDMSIELLVPNETSGTDNHNILRTLEGEVNSEVLSHCAIYKSNLSTETKSAESSLQTRSLSRDTTSPDPYQANLTEGGRFVRLVWEGCTVGGDGFFLHYEDENGDGLPDTVFGQGDRGSLSLLAVIEDSPLQAFHNCLLLSGTYDQEAWDQALVHVRTASQQAIPVIPPGHTGLQFKRTPPQSDASDALGQLQNLYQLLSIQVEEKTGFTSSKEGLPMGPTYEVNADGSDIWIYEKVVPIYRFAASKPDTGSTLLPGGESPYAGISQTATASFRFDWRDIFGNSFGQGAFTRARNIRYTDPLIGLHQWPGLGVEYTFTEGPNLVLNLNFETQSYETGTTTESGAAAPNERAAGDQKRYGLIFYQLAQADLKLEVECSLSKASSGTNTVYDITTREITIGETTKSTKAWLKDFAEEAYSYLGAVANGETDPTAPAALSFSIDLSETGSLPEALVFAVDVWFREKRDVNLVDADALALEPAIEKVESYIGPTTSMSEGSGAEATEESSGVLASLQTIAATLETAYPGLKAAVSQERLRNRGTDAESGQGLLWAVKLGTDGASYAINLDPAYFSLPPISQDLFNGEVELKDFDSGTGLRDATTPVRFQGLDLNLIALDALRTVESVLSPERLPVAYAANPTATRALLDQKLKLADTISGRITPVLEEDKNADDNQRGQAREAIRQRLLYNLVDGYEQETVVQFPVTVSLPESWEKYTWEQRTAPRLVGNVLVEKATQHGEEIDLNSLDFRFSPAKLALPNTPDGNSYLTVVFNTFSPEKYEGIQLQLRFVANELEYEIKDVNEDEAGGQSEDDPKLLYQASTWLSFILPDSLPSSDLGQQEIPLPLRTYPSPPSLISHRAEPDPDSEQSLESIREWQYVFIYEHPRVAQDTIETGIDYNLTSLPELAEDQQVEGASGLHGQLLQFAHVQAGLQQSLNRLDNLKVADAAGDEEARVALTTLSALATSLEAAWNGWNPLSQVSGTLHHDLNLVINEDIDLEGDAEVVQIEGEGSLASGEKLPHLVMEGYEEETSSVTPDSTGDGYSLSYTLNKTGENQSSHQGASDIPDRTLIVQNLDIVREQNAWAAVSLSRNTSLIPNKKTHPAFIFRTHPVRSVDFAVPMIVNEVFWDVAAIDNPEDLPRSLNAHLEALFGAVLPENPLRDFDIRMEARYSYALASGPDAERLDDDLIAEIPVALGLQVTINQGDSISTATREFREELAATLTDWQAKNLPSLNKAQYMFKLSIFSRLPAADMSLHIPLLRIEHLYLRMEDIQAD